MKKNIVCLDFKIQENNLDIKGIFENYHFFVNNGLKTIFPKRKNTTNVGLSYDFELNSELIGLISLICFSYEIRVSTSFKGFVINNNKNLNKLLFEERNLDLLKKKIILNHRRSSLDASFDPIGFNQLLPESLNDNSKNLGKRIFNDFNKSILTSNELMHLLTLIDYWRRAFDLKKMGFGMEAFLNYFKIIELLIKPNSRARLNDQLIKQELRRFRFASHSDLIILYRNLRNKFNIGHPVRSAPQSRAYDQYLSSLDDLIWNHIDDISQVSKLLIMRHLDKYKYKVINDGGLLFLAHKNIN